MASARYERGDIVRVNLEPVAGREMRGQARPALVLTPQAFNRLGDVLVAPITQGGDYSRCAGFAVSLTGTGCRTQGVALIDQALTLRIIAIKARTVFLTKAAGIDQFIKYVARDFTLAEPVDTVLPVAPCNIQPCQVVHLELAHGKAKLVKYPIHLLGQRALLQQEKALPGTLAQHTVANEAIADTDHYRHFPQTLAQSLDARKHLRRALARTHVLQQLHDVCRTEKVHADHILWPATACRQLIYIEIRRIGRHDQS